MRKLRTLDAQTLAACIRNNQDGSYPWEIGPLQTAIYVAVGGGFLGKLFAEQPADAYTDSRVGRRPYPWRKIENMRQVLCALAEARGLDPHHLPDMPDFHACGVF